MMSDPIYLQLNLVRGMTMDVARYVMSIKYYLDRMLPYIPYDMRGGVERFDDFFISAIQVDIILSISRFKSIYNNSGIDNTRSERRNTLSKVGEYISYGCRSHARYRHDEADYACHLF